MSTREEQLELVVCNILGRENWVPWKLLAALDNMARTTRKRFRPRCGAKTRSGRPCQAPAVWDKVNNRPRNGRCRLHGGLSTGPKTPEGKARCAEGRRRARERRKAEQQQNAAPPS